MVLLNTSLATTVSVDPQLLAHSSTSTALMSVQQMPEQSAAKKKLEKGAIVAPFFVGSDLCLW